MLKISRQFAVFFSVILGVFFLRAPEALALNTWERLDKKMKPLVFELNVGVKLRLGNGLWVQLADLSPKYRYPVFATTEDDKGFRVAGYGTTFPLKTNQQTKTYFITNRHVVESGQELIKECERFYAALSLAAEKSAGNGKDADVRFNELLAVINLCLKKEMSEAQRSVYQQTVNGIWDVYENYLSVHADPGRILFRKYLDKALVSHEIGYFLHKSGPISDKPLQAEIYKIGNAESEPDLAILQIDQYITGLEFDPVVPLEGEEIQVIGYPTASDQIDLDAAKYYAPTFNTGRVSRVSPRMLEVDAPITSGTSGGPVVSERGKVLGVVAVRALSARGGELPNFGGAVTASSVVNFAPELFGSTQKR